MMLVMNQADTIYEQSKHEINVLDDERQREIMSVYVYPTGGASPDNLTIAAFNRCELAVIVTRVWFNNSYYEVNMLFEPMEEKIIGSFDVDPDADGSLYDVLVATKRGNVFENGGGVVEWDGQFWIVENLMINVLISSPGTVFKVSVFLPGGGEHLQSPATVWKLGGSAFKTFAITENGIYTVSVKKGSKIISEEEVEMKWPDGPSVLWVYS